ncbi:MAG: FtsW/RodA/SpoVE family cell cycle protein, partial [Bacteroidales bacterium]|nr:FtsW/RodA/SpoVE family cell cycle protein [Bacteroidales bacterium]
MGRLKIRLQGDRIIWILVLCLAIISLLAVFSSSTFLANKAGVSKLYILQEQLISVSIGLAALLVCYLIPMRFYRFLAFPVFGITVVMLVLLFIIPDVRNEAARGIKLFGRTIQVFEFAKVGLILYIAKALELWENSLTRYKDFLLKILLPVGIVCIMVMANSFSSALLFGVISILLLFFMNVNIKHLGITAGIGILVVLAMFGIYSLFYNNKSHAEGEKSGSVAKVFNRFSTATNRIVNFFDAKEEMEEAATAMTPAARQRHLDGQRQAINAKVAIHEGGIIGKGPGKSTQRYSLSMAFSDFIYAFIVEEYGLLGGIVVILIYLIFLFRCITIANRCETIFPGALVLGLAFLIATQAFLHIMVNVGLMPVTGHTLPLISHGGTA